MKSFKEFVNENKAVNEAKDDFMGQEKHLGGDRYEIWIKGLNKAMKAAGVDKEEYIDADYKDFIGQEIFFHIKKAMEKKYKTKLKTSDGKMVNILTPKKVIVQF